MSSLPISSPFSELSTSNRPRANTNSSLTKPAPASGSPTTPQISSYLPFTFGVEFEVIMRPKTNVTSIAAIPAADASHRQLQTFNLALREVVAQILTANGMPCDVFDMDEEAPDYGKWNVMLDGSISKKHMNDGFYPMEIVSPLIIADAIWVQVIDTFWSVLLQHFELRRDTSCGFHIHTSTATGNYSLAQIRMMAKAIIFWEPATARCAPDSRQDRILGFCKSNIKYPVPVASYLSGPGPLRGLQYAYDYIDTLGIDAIVDFICPDKFRAWNFRPCRTGGHGSIEFRRAPGVVTAKKTKHWIAFTLAFIEMAIQFNPSFLAGQVQSAPRLSQISYPDFEEQLLACAKRLGVYPQLDPRLRQSDEPKTLHITTMSPRELRLLQHIDPEYTFSPNA